MRHPSYSRKERARLFLLRKGLCYLCGGKINETREAYDIEHEIPWEISYDNSDENLRLAHRKCHQKKTAADRKAIAHVHRMEAKHRGQNPKSRSFQKPEGYRYDWSKGRLVKCE